MTKRGGVLRRYTDLPSLLYLLRKKALTLLDPTFWDDKNDSYYLGLYKQFLHAKTLVVLCFSESPETYHQWHVFAGGASGVCIQFRRRALLASIPTVGFRRQGVQYLKLKELTDPGLAPQKLPFLKRFAFEHEREYRIIYTSTTETRATVDVSIPLSCITKVTLSPWMPRALAEEVKKVIRSVPECAPLQVKHSTLISNEQWKLAGDAVIASASAR